MNFPVQGNWKRKALAAVNAGLLEPARLSDLDVAHDAWCRHLRGGSCNCDPDLFLGGRKLVVSERTGDP